MKDRFYLACFRDNVGANVAFHCKNGRGYSTDIDKAQVYTRSQAQQAWEGAREYDQPLSADHIDAMSVWKVDMQYIPSETILDSGVKKWVGFQRGRYNGNDVFWLSNKLPVVDFLKAQIFSLEDVQLADEDIVYVPFDLANSVKRRTFDNCKISRPIMIQGAGLKTPDSVKRERRRKNNPKTKMRCESCGKFNWQLNPYEFEGCSSSNCEKYVS